MSYFNNVNDIISEIQIEGKYRGRSASYNRILARRSKGWNSTSVFGDVAPYLDTTQNDINAVAVGTTYYVVSTSTNDKAATAGVSKIRIVSLNNVGAVQVTEATLNGTTPVSIGSGYTAFQWMETSELGTGGLVAAGDITISSTNGAATPATTVEMILAGGNKSMSGRYKVPAGRTCYICQWEAQSAGGTATYDVRLRADVFSDDRAISTGIFHFQDAILIPNGGSEAQDCGLLKCPENSIIKMSCIPTASVAANRLDGHFDLLCISNT
jgi:hypothetical protein